MACDKNEMMAANFLFENAESLRAEMEEEAPAAGHPGAPAAPVARPPAAPAAPAAPAPAAAVPHVEAKKEEKKAEPEKKDEGTILTPKQ
ncbi:MAG: hypothetical protein P4L10_17705 [Acidobacteriaceae bacterium]|nr:hypothetical protein [Acidobacteriaceae bacterium]